MTDSQVVGRSPLVYLASSEDPVPDDIGGKARGLVAIAAAGLTTPPWFVVRPGSPDAGGTVSAGLKSEIGRACRQIEGDRVERFAVRSSALDEDAPERSFAGQYHTTLDVSGLENIVDAINKCLESGRQGSLAAYRGEAGRAPENPAMAVIVQRFIDPTAAGVAFSRAPLTGDDEVVIAATRGVAAALASGSATGDEYRVTRDGRVMVVRVMRERVLSDAQAREVADGARLLEELRGAPQDIEWAYGASGELFVLQARPITALGSSPPQDHVRLWDNANIVESFPDLTLPLTFSVAVELYATVYRNACLALGVPRRTVERESEVFEQMLGLHQGQVYYNLTSWYRVLALLPGFRFNAGFLEAMMGAGRPGAGPDERPLAAVSARARRFELTLSVTRLFYRLLRFDRDAVQFRTSIGRLLDTYRMSPAAGESPEGLLREFETIRTKALRTWRAPIMNDLFLMISHGALRRVAERWLGADANRLVNELLVQGNVASAVSGAELLRMSATIQQRGNWSDVIASTPPEALLARLAADPALGELDHLVGAYLATWADRAPRELQLERPSYRDDPLPLLRTLRSLVSAPLMGHPTVTRNPAREVRRRLLGRPGGPLRLAILWLLVRGTRRHVRWREEMRLARGQVFGVGRRIFKRLGIVLRDQGVLDEPDDVHHLSLPELRGLIHGSADAGDPRPLVRLRRTQYEEYARAPRLPSRFETIGVVGRAPAPDPREGEPSPARGMRSLRGIGVAAGRARGPCLVVRDPSVDSPMPGRIIATRTTDPGWIPLLVGAAGLLVEQGSLLSHSAIVARELSIPMVVGLPGLLDVVQSGDILSFDGSTGDVWLEAGAAGTP